MITKSISRGLINMKGLNKKREINILVVEDDQGLNYLISKKLDKLAYNYHQVYTGLEAIETIQNSEYDLVLLDYQLPDMTAEEVIKQSEEMPSFIIITANGDEEIAVDMMKSGAEDYLVKDHNFIHLLPQVIKRVLKELDNRRKLKEAYQELNKNIEKAREFHQHFLPESRAKYTGLTVQSYYQAANKLGGDFYNFKEVNNKLIFYVADVTGHGLDGAMLNLLIREKINEFIATVKFKADGEHREDHFLGPEKIMEVVLENYLAQDFPEDYFLCMQIGILDLEEYSLAYTNAGFHILPYIISSSGELKIVENSDLPIANLEAVQNDFVSNSYDLKSGAKLLITTDGLIEESKAGERYGYARLKKILKKYYYLPVKMLIEKIKRDFKNFAGGLNSQDDITILMIERDMEEEFESEIRSDFSEMYQLEEEMINFLAQYSSDVDSLKMGFHEMITNAIEHGNNFNNKKKVRVKISICAEYIRILISDEGSGFNWKEQLSTKEVGFAERGRGLIITSKVYDDLQFNSAGNQVCLIKFRAN